MTSTLKTVLGISFTVMVACCGSVQRATSDKKLSDTPDDIVTLSGREVVTGKKIDPAAVAAAASAPMTYDGLNGVAKNPIISHVFTADPSARVFDGRIYVYASHDLDEQTDYAMTDYHVFSSDDLVNWQDHGVALDAETMPWVDRLFAPDAAYNPTTGKYYLYFPNGGDSIGVAVSDTPYGPFKDALGGPLIDRKTKGVEDVEWVFDPACLLDDDGQVYLYFGGGMPGTGKNARVIRLNTDMVSLKDETATVIDAPDFFEAAFVHKYNGKYYFTYSTTFAEHDINIDYMMSDNPMSGFVYKGTVLPNPDNNRKNNNHHSIVQYLGNWYIFYHNRVLANRDELTEFQRSITLDHLTYRDNGEIVPVSATMGKVEQLKPIDAYARNEAETMADQRGIEVAAIFEADKHAGVMITDVHNGDWIGYSQVDFGEGPTGLTVRAAAAASAGGTIEIYVDGCKRFSNLPGKRIGHCDVKPTDNGQHWRDIECAIDEIEGVHDMYLYFTGTSDRSLLNFDWFKFTR